MVLMQSNSAEKNNGTQSPQPPPNTDEKIKESIDKLINTQKKAKEKSKLRRLMKAATTSPHYQNNAPNSYATSGHFNPTTPTISSASLLTSSIFTGYNFGHQNGNNSSNQNSNGNSLCGSSINSKNNSTDNSANNSVNNSAKNSANNSVNNSKNNSANNSASNSPNSKVPPPKINIIIEKENKDLNLSSHSIIESSSPKKSLIVDSLLTDMIQADDSKKSININSFDIYGELEGSPIKKNISIEKNFNELKNQYQRDNKTSPCINNNNIINNNNNSNNNIMNSNNKIIINNINLNQNYYQHYSNSTSSSPSKADYFFNPSSFYLDMYKNIDYDYYNEEDIEDLEEIERFENNEEDEVFVFQSPEGITRKPFEELDIINNHFFNSKVKYSSVYKSGNKNGGSNPGSSSNSNNSSNSNLFSNKQKIRSNSHDGSIISSSNQNNSQNHFNSSYGNQDIKTSNFFQSASNSPPNFLFNSNSYPFYNNPQNKIIKRVIRRAYTKKDFSNSICHSTPHNSPITQYY